MKWFNLFRRKTISALSVASVEHKENLPNWSNLVNRDIGLWSKAKKQAQAGENVLIATTVSGFSALTSLESMLAVALTLRGFKVSILLCDAALPVCLRAEFPSISDPSVIADYGIQNRLCGDCQQTGRYLFEALGLQHYKLSNLIDAGSRQVARELANNIPPSEIMKFVFEGIAVGEHATAGALRYFASGDINSEPMGDIVLRRYLEAAILTAQGLKQLTNKTNFYASCFNHGIYCPQGVIGEALRKAGVRVVNWNLAYRKKCFIFSHNDTYHHTLLDEPNEAWEAMHWSLESENKILTYLRSRWQGTDDWIWFHENPDERYDKIIELLDIDKRKPIIGMLTNVMWDAQLHYRANAFPSMLSWVLETIEHFSQRIDIQLVIRVHPAEVRGTLLSRQPIINEIKKVWPDLPPNIKIVEPESSISTYALMELCDSVLIYGTKTGVELASMGIPVIVAGEAWIRNKGVTLDASTRDEYLRFLKTLPLRKRLDEATRKRAIKYAFHFFYRRMIPLDFMEPTNDWPPYRISVESLDQLMPGKDQGLDLICEGIMRGSPFIYPAEELLGHFHG